MKNLTISIDDEAYRNARIWAAHNNTSVSAIVRDLLGRLRGARRTTATPPPSVHAPYQRKICQTCPLAKMQVNLPRPTTPPPSPLYPVKL